MSYPRGILTVLIILVIVTSEVAHGFMKLGLHHLLQKLDASKFDLMTIETKWIEQPLDHFDSSEKRTFKMRYFERLDLWQPNGPIYVYIGGEGAASESWIANDEQILICQMAKDTNGYLLATEHRYYGKSNPDISNIDKTEYYKFLSSLQALADIAYLIKFVKSDPKYKSLKVVVVGGSYAGNLATWMRELYPDLVDAAVAASAPVLAQKDFKEYLEIVTYTYGKYGSENCLNNIETNFKRYEQLLQNSDGIETLKRELNICPSNDLTVLENQQTLFTYLYYPLEYAAQYGNPRKIAETCLRYEPRYMLSMDLNLDNRARPVSLSQDCLDVDFINLVHYIDSWTYQYCTEFGYLQTTTSEKQPFVQWRPLEYVLKYCRDLVKGDIDKRIDEGVARTNKKYGGKHPNVSKVVFTHGDMDPWHSLGVLQDLGPDAPSTMVNETSHCAILVVQANEPEELTESRKNVRDLIEKWISTP